MLPVQDTCNIEILKFLFSQEFNETFANKIRRFIIGEIGLLTRRITEKDNNSYIHYWCTVLFLWMHFEIKEHYSSVERCCIPFLLGNLDNLLHWMVQSNLSWNQNKG